MIIPFSILFNIWTTFTIISILYFFFIVPFGVALKYDVYDESTRELITDVIFSFLLCVDIYLRSRLAYVVNERGESNIVTNIDQLQSYYVNNVLVYDILAAIPFDYLLLPLISYGLSKELLRFLRTLKLLKIIRFFETRTIIK